MIRSRIALTSLLLSVLGLASCGSSAALRAETEAPSGPITHSFLACGSNTRIVDGSGEVVWSYRLGSQDGQVLPNGNVLLAVKRCAEFPRGAVVEVTRDGEETVVWVGEQHEIHTVCPLADGRILVAEGGPKPRLLEIERSGEVVAVIPLACQTDDFHMGTRMARKLDDGTYLVPHLLDFAVKQYDAEGQVIAVFDTTAPGEPGQEVVGGEPRRLARRVVLTTVARSGTTCPGEASGNTNVDRGPGSPIRAVRRSSRAGTS